MKTDKMLRENRLVFYAQDIDRIHQELDGFLEMSKARAALVIDREGHLVTRRGEAIHGSIDSIAALMAGSFAATREMARLLGEDEFSQLFHQGQRDSIQVGLVGDRALFAIVFDDRTNLGLVRFYCQETLRRLGEILEEMDARTAPPDAENLSDDFSRSAAAALDRLF